MRPEQKDFLNLRRLPGRLTLEETAYLLGIQFHDIPILIAKGLLRPLSGNVGNTTKWFAAVAVERLALDEKYLDRVTAALRKHWRDKNYRRDQNGHPTAREVDPGHHAA